MPVGPGCRIRHARLQDEGTFGWVLRSAQPGDLNRYVLSAAHVLNPGGYGERDDAIQAVVNGAWTTIATLEDWTAINGLSPDGIAIDAAIARLLPEFAAAWAPVADAPVATGQADFIFPGMPLRLYGALTARPVDAEVESSGGREILVDYRMSQSSLPLFAMKVRDQVFYGRNIGGWRAVTQGGDSGALVVDVNGHAVGLHIGSTNANAGLNVSVCTPIRRILDRFKMHLDLGANTPAVAAGAEVLLPGPSLGTAANALSDAAGDALNVRILPLLQVHRFGQGVSWQLTPSGVRVDGVLLRTGGQPVTVAKVWTQYIEPIRDAAREYKVPVELIVATICTESHGNPNAFRHESQGRMSVGLMQTLIGTARETMSDDRIDADWLRVPRNSIRAGTCYIAGKRHLSRLDPPWVAAIYNSGGLTPAFNNRWGFTQNVIGQVHVDAFIAWFNDCFAFFEAAPPDLPADVPSFWKLLKA
jgi:hypothetical protein